MAISFDNSISGSYGTNSMSYTVGSGSNRILIIDVFWNFNGSEPAVPTFNGATATKIDSSLRAGAFATVSYYLVNPDVGTFTLATSSGAAGICIMAKSYFGVHQSSPIDSHNNGSNNSSSPTLAVSTTVIGANCWLVGASISDSGGGTSGTLTTSETSRGLSSVVGGFARFITDDSNGTVGTGSQTVTWSNTMAGPDNYGVLFSMFPAPTDLSLNISDSVTTVDANTPDIISTFIRPAEVKGVKIIG